MSEEQQNGCDVSDVSDAIRTYATTLTEYLSAVDNTDDSIEGAAKITHIQNGTGVWQTDDGEGLEEDPDDYRVECSCGESFDFCGLAIYHVEEEH